MTSNEWDFIIDKIQAEQCILVLGPEAYVDETGKTFRENLFEYLNVPNNSNIHRHYTQDDFFLFDDSYKRTLTCHQIKRFYQAIQPTDLLDKIAHIPFHIILTLTPDRLLPLAFEHAGLNNYQFRYYKKNKDPQPILTPSGKSPLVYNMFGSIDNEESLILTYDDLYDYFKSIFARKSMPDKLKASLMDMKNIIFLGVPFDKWYMQLLLRELEIHKQYEFTRYAANQLISEDLKAFCYDQFRIHFVSNHIQEFVNNLYQLCLNDGILRTPNQEQDDANPEHIRKLISKGSLDRAIEFAQELLEQTDYESAITLLAGRFGRFKKRMMQGVLRSEEQEILQNQLIVDLLNLVDEAKSNLV